MSGMWDDLRKRVENLSDGEILAALAAGPGDYREEALAIYREEAEQRGLDLAVAPSQAPDDEEPDIEVDGDDVGIRPAPGAVSTSGAGEFMAGDREVHCAHCDATTFVEHQVVLASALQGTRNSAVPLPVTVLVCTSCGCLQWFGEPA